MKRISFFGVCSRRSCRSSQNHSNSASSALLQHYWFNFSFWALQALYLYGMYRDMSGGGESTMQAGTLASGLNSPWLGRGASENVLQTRRQWQPVGIMRACVCTVTLSCLTLFEPVTPRLLCPWVFPGKNAREDSYFLLWGIFPSQGLNLGLLHCRQIFYQLSHKGSPKGQARKKKTKNKQIN